MSEKNHPINNDEIFKKLIQKKLENHQTPVPEDIWNGIEQKLAIQPKKRRFIGWYWATAGVAACIALLFLFNPNDIPHNTQNLTKVQEQSARVGPEPSTTSEMSSDNSEGVDNEKNPQSHPTVTEKAVGLFSQKSKQSTQSADRKLITQSSSKKDKTDQLPKKSEFVENSLIENQTVEQDLEKSSQTESTENKFDKIDKLPDLNDYATIPEQPKRTKKNRRMLLAASFGTGGNTLANQVQEQQAMPSIPPRMLVNKEVTENYQGIKSAEDFSKAEHQPPISFGLMIEKPLTDRISLESGLVYTYLHSKLRKPGNVDLHSTLQLHYLGIPLNVKATAFKTSGWSFYGSVGGMAEKGLRSYYSQVEESADVKRDSNVKSTIDGFQFSLSGAIGADYKVNKSMSLFIEPKVTYYLENNQPMSARTEQPLNIGVAGGVRFGL